MPTDQLHIDPPELIPESPPKPTERDRQSASVPVEQKFIRLRDEWKAQRGHESSTMKVLMIPAYQQIIGMRPAAIPYLLRELPANLFSW